MPLMGRKYTEKLSSRALNSRINQELEYGPKIYLGENKDDGYKLLALARVNPPGRVLYHNCLFDWKVLPNFQDWNTSYPKENSPAEFLDYDWREAGNLGVLRKQIIPTDNMLISEWQFRSGDSTSKIITLSK